MAPERETPPRVRPLGDRVALVEFGDTIDEAVNTRVHAYARALARGGLAGVADIVPTYRSVCVHFDPLVASLDDVAHAVAAIHGDGPSAGVPQAGDGRTVEVPVVYGGEFGPDLDDVAGHCGLSPDEVVARHAGGTYRVFMMGFTPGFPYLGGMDPRLATPRLASPRTRVPAGSVGIAGPQTGVYPTDSPGGWRLIGRTPLRLFDPGTDPPSLLDAGDTVRFTPVAASVFREGAAGPLGGTGTPGSLAGFEVLDAGALTTVQDLGRFGYQRFGVPVAGAMDAAALRLANRLVANPDDAAGLEMTMAGPVLRFDADAVVAVAGADFVPRVNGRAERTGRAFRVRAGDRVSFDPPPHGLRGYLACRGGLAVPLVMGSRSTYLPSAFGGHDGRALRAGDRVPIGPPAADAAPLRVCPAPSRVAARVREVRVITGPDTEAFTEAGLRTFLSSVYTMSPRSDRIGCRFDGPAIAHRAGADIVSDGTACGVVQVSGDGLPIVLMADRGTTGGYTRVATVVGADLAVIAQARPGDAVSFRAVGLDAAVDALRDQEAGLERLQTAGASEPEPVFDDDAGAAWAAAASRAFAAALGGPAGETTVRVPGVRAGMAGLVAAVSVAAGDLVAERQTLLVIEAMKMQNPVRAPRAGRVARVCAAAGTEVTADTVVIEFEE